MRRLIWLAGATLLLFAAYRLLLSSADPRSRDANGHCLLRARVYTDGEGLAQPRRVFGMQNLDEADWADVQIKIDGVGTSGSLAGKPTGAYTLTLPGYDSAVLAHKVKEVPLESFQQSGGPRWVPMTMRVRHATIAARIGAEACTYETDLPGR